MQNTSKIILVLLFSSFWSCNNTKQGELEFVSLERTNGKRLIERFDSTKGYYYGETVFVKNPPENKGYDLENMMLYYLSKYGIDFTNMGYNSFYGM